MSLNTNNFDSPKGGDLGTATVGPHVARLVGVVDLGVHKRTWQQQEKEPCRKLNLILELTDDFVEIDGVVKPRIISKSVNAINSEKSALNAILAQLDPTGQFQGDLEAMAKATLPCIVTVAQRTDNNGNIVEGTKIANIGACPQNFQAPAAQNPIVIFDTYNPDINVFMGLQAWMKKMIKEAQNYTGSQLEQLVLAAEAQAGNTAQAAPAGPQTAQAAPSTQAVAAAPVQPVAATAEAPAQAQAAPPAGPAPAAQTQTAPATPAAPPGFRFDPATNSYVPDTQAVAPAQQTPAGNGTPY